MFKNGDKIQLKHQGGVIQGVVRRVTKKNMEVIDRFDSANIYKISSSFFPRIEYAEFEVQERSLPVFVKGDKVQFEHDGKKIKGIVTKVTSKKYQITEYGNPESVWSILKEAPILQAGDFEVVIDDMGVMNPYEVKNYKDHPDMSDETPCFSCDIYKNGKKIGTARNDGRGGPTMLWGVPDNRNEISTFEKDAQQWAKDIGLSNYEPFDKWIFWFVNERPYGVTQQKLKEEWDEIMSLTKG